MKRILPLLLALLLLAACGTDTPSETPANTAGTPAPPSASPSPERPTPTPDAVQSVPVDFHLPDAGFEPDSYWLAESFGDGGQALMLTFTDDTGATDFKCWYSVYDEVRSGGRTERDLICGSFTAGAFSGGGFERSNDGLTASVSISGDTLSVSCTVPEDYPPLPESFARTTEEGALEAYRDMPYMGEATLPVPIETSREELEAMPGMESGVDGGYEYNGAEIGIAYEYFGGDIEIGSVVSAEPDSIPDLRGVKIGSSAEDVLACFPGEITALPGDQEGKETTVYGTDGMLSASGVIAYDGDVPCLVLTDRESVVVFRFDANGLVSAVIWYTLP